MCIVSDLLWAGWPRSALAILGGGRTPPLDPPLILTPSIVSYLHINLYITVAGYVSNLVIISDEHEPPLPEDVAERYRELIEGGGGHDAEIEAQGSYI